MRFKNNFPLNKAFKIFWLTSTFNNKIQVTKQTIQINYILKTCT